MSDDTSTIFLGSGLPQVPQRKAERPPSNASVWFAVLGGGIAWLIQFAANVEFNYSRCVTGTSQSDLPLHDWSIGLSVAAFLVALAASTQTLRLYRLAFLQGGDIDAQERRGDGSPPPFGRIHFLTIVACVVNGLALTMVIMTGVGASLLQLCQQA